MACKVDGCDTIAKSLGWCEKHYTRWRRHGDPEIRKSTVAEIPPATGKDNPSWKGDAIGYAGAHVRVRSHRGSASTYDCIDCGRQAAHWSFNHDTPSERTRESDRGYFSIDVADWDPRCVRCHQAYDRRERTS